MRPYDRYQIELAYYKKHKECRHKDECRQYCPECYEKCPGLEGFLCEPMKECVLLGESIVKKAKKEKINKEKVMPFDNIKHGVPLIRTDGQPSVFYGPKKVTEPMNNVVASVSWMFSFIGITIYALFMWYFDHTVWHCLGYAEPLIYFLLVVLFNYLKEKCAYYNDETGKSKYTDMMIGAIIGCVTALWATWMLVNYVDSGDMPFVWAGLVFLWMGLLGALLDFLPTGE